MMKFVRATVDHVAELAPKLRQADKDELAGLSDITPEEGLWQSFYQSNMRWAILLDGEVVCIFGCGDRCPWMLASEKLPLIRHAIAKNSRKYMRFMLRQHGFLFNFVDSRNALSIKWLKWLGFEFGEPFAGKNGTTFYPFFMSAQRRKKCATSLLV